MAAGGGGGVRRRPVEGHGVAAHRVAAAAVGPRWTGRRVLLGRVRARRLGDAGGGPFNGKYSALDLPRNSKLFPRLFQLFKLFLMKIIIQVWKKIWKMKFMKI